LKYVKKIFRIIRAILFLPFWWLERLIPRDKNIFVFGSWKGRYSDNARALFEYILNNEPKIKPYWIAKEKKLFQKLINEKKPVVMAYSLKGWLISLRAFFAFNIVKNDLNLYALNGAIRICLWHGMPLKKIQHDTKYFQKAEGKDGKISSKIKYIMKKTIYPYNVYNRRYNITISSSEFLIPFLSSGFLLNQKCIWLTGLPRTDWFYKEKMEKIISDLRSKYIQSRIILFMPTFRLSIHGGEVYNPFDGNGFNSEDFVKFLEEENIVFLYKPHFHDRRFDFLLSSDRFVLINDDDYDELYVLISNIDILVTDYSSVYFDFFCLNNPAILTPFDYDFYTKELRGHYFDYNLLPSIKAYNWDELMDIITEKKYYSLSKEEAEIFCKYNDGHASERCLQKTLDLLKKEA
jgi:CDP-glycerol glycerophosphotransferase